MCDLIGVLVEKRITATDCIETLYIYKRSNGRMWIVPSVRGANTVQAVVQEVCSEFRPFKPHAWMERGNVFRVYVQINQDWGPYNVMLKRSSDWRQVYTDSGQFGIPVPNAPY